MEGKSVLTKVIPRKPVLFKIPPVVHARFKAACILEGISMSRQVTELMKGYADDLFDTIVFAKEVVFKSKVEASRIVIGASPLEVDSVDLGPCHVIVEDVFEAPETMGQEFAEAVQRSVLVKVEGEDEQDD